MPTLLNVLAGIDGPVAFSSTVGVGIMIDILIQTSIMGVAAGILAMPIEVGMGALLIGVIDLRSFGLTIPVSVGPLGLLLGLLLAGLDPALRAAAASPGAALREE